MKKHPQPSSVVSVRRINEKIAVVEIQRPEVRNALNLEVRQRLAAIFADLSMDQTVRAIVLTGGEQCFAAGADLKEIQMTSAIEMHQRGLQRLWGAIASCPKPIVAGVEGLALGGGLELAMHADIMVVSRSAKLGQTEVRVGLMPGAGGTQRLARLVGRQRAMRMLLTGEIITGEQALEMGLAAELVDDGRTFERSLALAKVIASMPPLAIEQIKEVMNTAADLPLEAALTLERKSFQLLFASEDMREGVAAFFAKRQAHYRGI